MTRWVQKEKLVVQYGHQINLDLEILKYVF